MFAMQRERLVLVSLGAVLVFVAFVAPTAAAQLSQVAPIPTPPGKDPDPQPQQIDPAELPGKINKAGDGGLDAGGPKAPSAPGSGTGLREIGGAVSTAITANWALTSAITAGVAGVGFASWFLASRYVDPKVALRNPQRSMLYGFVKGNPGVHLKQLSNEFHMKTSTVLWHIRKLEHADLVRSKKANGYRVFYPVSGGMEAKQLSTAVTALSNQNAKQVFEFVALNPGAHRRILSGRLVINPGTVRWHLKKLREAGLIAELAQDRFSTYYATDLGLKAMRQVASLPAEITAPVINVAALPAVEPFGEEADEPQPVFAQ
jgi:DNA-binding transcriptional ArsR family regulator